MDKYTFEQKKSIVGRINKLEKNSRELIHIKDIITKNNTNAKFMKNNNGYFFQFHNLSFQTYKQIEEFLDKTDKKKQKAHFKKLNSMSENISDPLTDTITKKLRLTNAENHILNRIKYENELKKNETGTSNDDLELYCQDVSRSENNNIFVKKN